MSKDRNRVTTAMIMAAGLGTRMAPLTEKKPKALIPLLGRPLISYILEGLAKAGIKRVVINIHAHAELFRNYLKHCEQFGLCIIISDETETLLETGGGLRKALPLIRDVSNPVPDSVLIVNVDAIYLEKETGISFQYLIGKWQKTSAKAILALSDLSMIIGYQGYGDFNLILSEIKEHYQNATRFELTDQKKSVFQLIRYRKKPNQQNNKAFFEESFQNNKTVSKESFVYAGSQIISLDGVEKYSISPFSFNRIWDDLLKQNQLFGVVLKDMLYLHIGDPISAKLGRK